MKPSDRPRASEPEQLSQLFVEFANAGDLEGLLGLYEPEAVVAFPPGELSRGRAAIRRAYERMLAARPSLVRGRPRPTLRVGDLALTSTALADGGASAEVARRQPDGSWLWILDQPNVLG